MLLVAAACGRYASGPHAGAGARHRAAANDLGISRVDYAQLNLWATLIGSLCAIGIGRFIDRLGTRVVLTVVAIALGAS